MSDSVYTKSLAVALREKLDAQAEAAALREQLRVAAEGQRDLQDRARHSHDRAERLLEQLREVLYLLPLLDGSHLHADDCYRTGAPDAGRCPSCNCNLTLHRRFLAALSSAPPQGPETSMDTTNKPSK